MNRNSYYFGEEATWGKPTICTKNRHNLIRCKGPKFWFTTDKDINGVSEVVQRYAVFHFDQFKDNEREN